MSIQLHVDNVNIPVNFVRFSDGASNVKLDWPEGLVPQRSIAIAVNSLTPADATLWEILLVVHALTELTKDSATFITSTLVLDYLPHARADRVFEKGNAEPLWLFCRTVFEFFDEVIVKDVHNRAALDLAVECADQGTLITEITQTECFLNTVGRTWFNKQIILVAPDKGARGKVLDIDNAIDTLGGFPVTVQCDKLRDISTGRIIDTHVPALPAHAEGRTLIVDDILDGGGTFIPLAEKLREKGAQSVELYVTHGIFAKGLNIFRGLIDKIYVHNIVGTYITRQDIINFNEGKEVK